MPQDHESLDLVARYLNSPDNPSLLLEITTFRSASAANESYFLEMEKIWNYSQSAALLEQVDVKVSARKLQKNLNQPTVKLSPKFTWLKGIAASLFVLVVGYWVYVESNTPTYLIKTTAKNQIDSVKLSDGSVIILAENSELKYPDKFGSTTREIFLSKGQAFFKIAKDAAHPFKVNLNKSDVTVLGTSFNIKLTDSSIVVGIKTGRVLFSPYKGGAHAILDAGEAITYDLKGNAYITTNAQNLDSWLTNELVFVDTPLEEVCKQLSNYYGVVIKLQNDKYTGKKLNAKFNDQTLNDVLIILNETYNIKINKEHNQINLITPKKIN